MAAILVAGLASVDFIFYLDTMPTRAEKYRARDALVAGGGGAANAAVAVARLGGTARLASTIGDDPIGDLLLADLEAEGVETALVQRDPGARSAFSSVLIDAAGERQIIGFRGAGQGRGPDLVDAPPCDAVLADTRLPDLTRAALALARRRGIPGILDGEHPVDPALLTAATHIAFSAQGLRGLTGIDDLSDALQDVAVRTTAWICVTDGAAGVWFMDEGTVTHIAAFGVEAVDTLAAGDVWHGAFALRLAEGAGEGAAIGFANAAASLKCGNPGGRSGCPDRAAVAAFMRAQLPRL